MCLSPPYLAPPSVGFHLTFWMSCSCWKDTGSHLNIWIFSFSWVTGRPGNIGPNTSLPVLRWSRVASSCHRSPHQALLFTPGLLPSFTRVPGPQVFELAWLLQNNEDVLKNWNLPPSVVGLPKEILSFPSEKAARLKLTWMLQRGFFHEAGS